MHTEFEMQLRRAIANNLKRLLSINKMSQRQLSLKTGIPTSTISDYVNARSLAVPGNIEKMARALGVSKEEIDPSFGDAEAPVMYDPRLRFFDEIENELGIDLTDPKVQKKVKKVIELLFADED